MACIPRPSMPQVDMKDLPGLFSFLHGKGIGLSFVYAPTRSLHTRQCLGQTCIVPDREVLVKPIIITKDLAILDGNRRWRTLFDEKRAEIPAFLLGAPFDVAFDAVKMYGATYTYGDGAFHPITY